MQRNPWASPLFLLPDEIWCEGRSRVPQIGVAMEKILTAALACLISRCHLTKGELEFLNMSERRRFPRYSAHVNASIKLPGENTAHEVMVEDLSILGCMLESCPVLEIRQGCEFAMTWKGREFHTAAVVAWKSEQGAVGLEFLNATQEKLQMVRGICADLTLKPLVPM